MIKNTVSVITAAFAILAALVLLAGCSDNSNEEIVGSWIPTTAYINGKSVKYSELDIDESQFGFTFEANGNFTATLANVDYSGTYVFNDTSIDLAVNGSTQKLDYDNGTITLTLDYGSTPTTFSFIKEAE